MYKKRKVKIVKIIQMEKICLIQKIEINSKDLIGQKVNKYLTPIKIAN